MKKNGFLKSMVHILKNIDFFCECMMLVRMKYKARHDYLDGVEKRRGFAEKQRLYVKSFEYHRNDNERRKS